VIRLHLGPLHPEWYDRSPAVIHPAGKHPPPGEPNGRRRGRTWIPATPVPDESPRRCGCPAQPPGRFRVMPASGSCGAPGAGAMLAARKNGGPGETTQDLRPTEAEARQIGGAPRSVPGAGPTVEHNAPVGVHCRSHSVVDVHAIAPTVKVERARPRSRHGPQRHGTSPGQSRETVSKDQCVYCSTAH